MNEAEQAAHDYIANILDQAYDGWLTHQEAVAAAQGSLERFRPRCPKCSSVVSFTPWQGNLRAARCGKCQHLWKEAM